MNTETEKPQSSHNKEFVALEMTKLVLALDTKEGAGMSAEKPKDRVFRVYTECYAAVTNASKKFG
ncbi:MAG TPA: hypothetical protein VHY22_13370 [Chthoniobacteraceae bacterium]|jgi:hypothetical protein|nr:hypothetical protein [Chthoniobacteraceae bacterium]